MGYDLKAGFILRAGHRAAFEADGRRQQLYAAMAAFIVAIVVVGLSWEGYFAQNLILAGGSRLRRDHQQRHYTGAAATSMMLWAIPRAPCCNGSAAKGRQLGVLFATGLLIASPLAGWAVLVGIACRQVWLQPCAVRRGAHDHGGVRRRRDRGRCVVPRSSVPSGPIYYDGADPMFSSPRSRATMNHVKQRGAVSGLFRLKGISDSGAP